MPPPRRSWGGHTILPGGFTKNTDPLARVGKFEDRRLEIQKSKSINSEIQTVKFMSLISHLLRLAKIILDVRLQRSKALHRAIFATRPG